MHLSVTPTSQLSAPKAKTISVALGKKETTRMAKSPLQSFKVVDRFAIG
jgi:hypothetical protein